MCQSFLECWKAKICFRELPKFLDPKLKEDNLNFATESLFESLSSQTFHFFDYLNKMFFRTSTLRRLEPLFNINAAGKKFWDTTSNQQLERNFEISFLLLFKICKELNSRRIITLKTLITFITILRFVFFVIFNQISFDWTLQVTPRRICESMIHETKYLDNHERKPRKVSKRPIIVKRVLTVLRPFINWSCISKWTQTLTGWIDIQTDGRHIDLTSIHKIQTYRQTICVVCGWCTQQLDFVCLLFVMFILMEFWGWHFLTDLRDTI